MHYGHRSHNVDCSPTDFFDVAPLRNGEGAESNRFSQVNGIITPPRQGSGVLRSVCVCLSVCLSVRERMSGTVCARKSCRGSRRGSMASTDMRCPVKRPDSGPPAEWYCSVARQRTSVPTQKCCGTVDVTVTADHHRNVSLPDAP